MTKAHKIDGLKVGMIINSKTEVAKLIGYTKSNYTTAIQCALKHYCKFHVDKSGHYYIDQVFDEPIPFRSGFLHTVGEIITVANTTYKIIDRYIKEIEENGTIRTRSVYLCKCLNDGYEFERYEGQIEKNYGCPICSGKVTSLGYNTIYDLRKDLIPYFVNQEETKIYSVYSNNYTWLRCPVCGTKKYMYISNLSKNGFVCDYCSDGLSYVNKFVRNFLNQLHIDYTPECSFKWSQGRIYDQYIENKNMIIENHGEQHYGHRFNGYLERDDKEVDNEKRCIAINNGIQYYIELDCRESTVEYIKNSIMNSILPDIFCFSENDIDWNECGDYASSSLMHKVWDYWNKGISLREIQNSTGLSYTTIETYIKRGSDIGKVKYRFAKDNPDYKEQHGISTSMPLICVTDNIAFSSSKLAEDYYRDKNVNLIRSSINRAALHNTVYKNKQFKYITKKEFNELKLEQKSNNMIYVIGEIFDKYYIDQEELKNKTA